VNRTRLAVLVLVGAALVALLWWTLGRDGRGPAALEASGTVEATEADLGFQAAGRLTAVPATEGTRVVRGDTLALLDRDELAAALEAAEAQVAAAEARLRELRLGSRPQEIASARAALAAATQRETEARSEAERARRLHEGGALSRQALDRAETALEAAAAAREQAAQALALAEEGPRRETIEVQDATLRQARASESRARAALAHTVLLAPRDGLVTVRHREPGEIVGPGAPVVTLMDPDDRWVRIYVREDRVGRVSLGQEAEIRIDAYPDRTFRGHVTFIGSEAEFTPRNVQTPDERTQLVYPVKVQVTGDSELVLKPGLPADVRLPEGV
jgi:HlyD family secretion protein